MLTVDLEPGTFLDISEFMVGDNKESGPFVCLKSATKMQMVQARVTTVGCQKDKSGVVVTLSAGIGTIRAVSHKALIPWEQITFQNNERPSVLGNKPSYHASLHWREFVLSGYVDNSLRSVLPPEALARFNVAARDIPKPDPEKEARWKAEQAAHLAAVQKEKEARNLLRTERDRQVVAACQDVSLTTHQRLHAVASILRHSQYPKCCYTGSKLPTGRSACKNPMGTLISWIGYDVFHSVDTTQTVRNLCMEHQKAQVQFWQKAGTEPDMTMEKLFGGPESAG